MAGGIRPFHRVEDFEPPNDAPENGVFVVQVRTRPAVSGSGFRVSGLGFWVQGLGFGVPVSVSWISSLGFRDSASGVGI